MKILSATDYCTKLRVSIQTSGKLGFSNEAANSLGISESSQVKFGQDENDPQVLYLIMPDEQCFSVKPSGKYFYVPTKTLFDALAVTGESLKSFSYDSFGRMTSDGLDGVTVDYNCFDLPRKISSGGSTDVNYCYLSDGTKVRIVRRLLRRKSCEFGGY